MMKNLKFVLLAVIALVSVSLVAQPAAAKSYIPTISSNLRGTWYLWNKKNHQRMTINKHSYHIDIYKHGKYHTVKAVNGYIMLDKKISALIFAKAEKGYWYIGQNSGGPTLYVKRTTHHHKAALARPVTPVDDDLHSNAKIVYYTHTK